MTGGNLQYNGQFYHISLRIFSPIENFKASEINGSTLSILLYDNVEELVIKNSIKDFLLNGHVIYKDNSVTEISRYLESPISYLEVAISKLKDMQSSGQSLNDEELVFNHTFIIDKIEKLEQTTTSVTYKMDFISAIYWNFFANIQYSTASKPTSPISILTHLYKSANVELTPSDFDTGVRIPYITSSSECLFTAQDYLIKRCFDRSKPETPGVFSIVYDHMKNKFDFWRLSNHIKSFVESGDVENVNKIVAANKHYLNINVYNEYTDSLQNEDPNTIQVYQQQYSSTLFDLIQEFSYWDFNYSTNLFTRKNVLNSEIVEKFIPTDSQSKLGYDRKFMDNEHTLINTIPESQRKFSRDSSKWDEIIFPYNDMMTLFMESTCSVVNTQGDLTRKPGESYQLTIDTSDQNPLMNLTGDWVCFSVEHIFTPNKYRNNIYMGRLDRTNSKMFK